MANSSYSSNRSSVEPTSNPGSPSPSPSGGPSDPRRREHERASQRVKCDEGKPACLRCTSTGRTCDGYDKAALARSRSADPSQTAELARAEFVRACEWNEALRSMRRIEADIDGTETEKRLFARFRAATADGAASHLCNFTAFWRRLSPATGCQEEAVKHAVVALAAAYQLFQYPNEPVIDGFTRSDLDVFTIQQYNRSIERLQGHAKSSAAESIRVTLVCCLAFISLETLRGNHDVAVAHLINGLRILQSLPDSTFDCLADSSIFVWPTHRDSLHMPDIIQLFARLELSACLFTHGIQPVLSERGYRTRHFDDGASMHSLPDVLHARMAMSTFQHDAVARLHEIAAVTAAGDESAAIFWSDPVQQRQQACLLARSTRLGALTADFFSPARFGTPDPTTPDLYGLYLDLLHFRCAQFLLAQTTAPNTTFTPNLDLDLDLNFDFNLDLDPFFPAYHPHATSIPTQTPPTQPDPSLLPSILHLATRLSASPFCHPYSHPHQPPPPRPLTDLRTPLLGPLYLVALHTPPPHTTTTAPNPRTTAIHLLTECLSRLWQPHSSPQSNSNNNNNNSNNNYPASLLGDHADSSGGGGGGTAAAGDASKQWVLTLRGLVEQAVDGGRERMQQHHQTQTQRQGQGQGRVSSSLLLSTEVPRALTGAGCLPLLWDVVVAGAGLGPGPGCCGGGGGGVR
ncbi:hypothetical protein NEMBOFW57_007599 [Staphylotrichum longicolle]|uniref:Zn(2)-C6 fungal-type domain-containing protein n=1 Tax=Staphylotrichum longicolle TaxID=669026 RepID=A0AAD4I0L1_9PEZI|nr:hypothetical protein NEMBOFW57_007599 [Staphylotrichum longicolle]